MTQSIYKIDHIGTIDCALVLLLVIMIGTFFSLHLNNL